MIRRCLDADSVFGVALPLQAPNDVTDQLPVGVGTSARIGQVFPLPGGRFNLQTSGDRRFCVQSVEMVDGYALAEVEWLQEAPPDVNLDFLASQVRAMAQKYFQALAEETGLYLSSEELMGLPQDPLELSMWVAATMPLQIVQKQLLLEQTFTQQRLEYLLSYLHREDIIRRAAIKQGVARREIPTGDPYASLN